MKEFHNKCVRKIGVKTGAIVHDTCHTLTCIAPVRCGHGCGLQTITQTPFSIGLVKELACNSRPLSDLCRLSLNTE